MKRLFLLISCCWLLQLQSIGQVTDAAYMGGIGDGQTENSLLPFSPVFISSFSPFAGGGADGSAYRALNNYSGLPLALSPFYGAQGDGSGQEKLEGFAEAYIGMFNPFAGAVGDGGGLDSLIIFGHEDISMYGPYAGMKGDGNSHDSLINFSHQFISMYGPFAGGEGDGWTGHLVLGVSLPVALLDFYGEKRNGDHMLHWSVTEEINLHHYELHHSYDGKVFTKLGDRLPGAGSGQKNYFYINQKPNSGNSYYRLKMVDIDGTYEWTSTVLLHESDITELSIYPNPTQNDLTLDIRSNPDKYGKAVLLTLDGKVIQTFEVEEADTRLIIPMAELPSAHYILLFQNKSERIAFKIAKE